MGDSLRLMLSGMAPHGPQGPLACFLAPVAQTVLMQPEAQPQLQPPGNTPQFPDAWLLGEALPQLHSRQCSSPEQASGGAAEPPSHPAQLLSLCWGAGRLPHLPGGCALGPSVSGRGAELDWGDLRKLVSLSCCPLNGGGPSTSG